MKNFINTYFGWGDKETKHKVMQKLCASTFVVVLPMCIFTCLFEVFFMLLSFAHPEIYGGAEIKYRIMYALMFSVSAISIIIALYAKRDMGSRFMIYKVMCLFMSVFLMGWVLTVTYLDSLKNDQVSPALFMTMAITIPLCFFLEPVAYIVIDIAGCMLFFMINDYTIKRVGAQSYQYLNYLIYFISQFCLGLSYILVKRRQMKDSIISESQKQHIENLLNAQSSFFSSMSHEIRTPVNTIVGLNEMILREDISDEVAEDAENVRAAGKILLQLVNDILDMSKLESGQMVLTPVEYNSADMISELVGMFSVKAKEKKLKFPVMVSPDLPVMLHADDVRIKQILINVLGNAFKYTNEGSVSLSVECGKKEADTLNVIYSVTDSGIGIKKENIPYLFSAFKRVEEGDVRHIEGTGLGLSIVKQFVDLMGGKITVNSIYSQGTTFVIEIPQKVIGDDKVGQLNLEEHILTDRDGAYTGRFVAPDARVLIVDDNATNLMVAEKLLRDTKVYVKTVTSGNEALNEALNENYHVIFMDDLMPGLSGVETLHKLRTQVGGLCNDSKIVALTAKAGNENRLYYEREGFDGYVSKPVTGNDLEKELLRLLPRNMVDLISDNDDLLESTVSWMNNDIKRKYISVSTESVCDIPDELLEKYDIDIIHHKICTNSGTFKDSYEIDTRGVISFLNDPNNRVTSKEPDVLDHESFFIKELNKANNIIHVTTSEKVKKSAYKNAVEASSSFDSVTIVDSGHLSSGHGLVVLEACRLAAMGQNPQDIARQLKDFRNKVHTSFIVDNPDYMSRSGHVNEGISTIMNSMAARPVIRMKNGRMGIKQIIFESRQKAWEKYIATSLSPLGNIDRSVLFITYAGLSVKELEYIRSEVEFRVRFDKIYYQEASPAISVNCGPGSFGLIFKEI